MQTTKDLYKVLGLPRGASHDDIRKAHRKLVRRFHPDANPQDPRAEERFKEVQQAYEVLSNEQKRREYDQRFHSSYKGGADRPRAQGAGERSGGDTTSTVHLSDLLGKLANLTSSRIDGRGEVNRKLQDEDIARIAKHLGIDISRLSKILGENIIVNAKVSFGDTPSERFTVTDEQSSSRKPSGASKRHKESE
ncbi:MAG: DnaJ domain-containing protein [Actinomycetota bacterium]|nr:DnaJ domain-containing protein [Actinomycetota bacterium]